MRIIGQEQIASILGITPRSVTEWQQQGMPIAVQGGPGVPGEYDSEACIRWLVQREVCKVQGPEAPKDRLARLQGDALEIDLAERRGKLIEASSVEPMMRAAIVSARERIRNEPARIAALMEGKSKTEREAMLRELLDETLAKLSRWQQPALDENEEQVAHEHAA